MIAPLFTHLPVTCNSAYVSPGSTFVAIEGFKIDGALFIADAIARGATTIVAANQNVLARKYAHNYPATSFEFVCDPRKELALRAAEAFGYPAKHLTLIAVTGTKGKTTTSFLIHHMLKAAGIKAALLGSVKNTIDGYFEEESSRATMGADYLNAFFHHCLKACVSHVVVEVSSHAIALDRIFGLTFQAVVFTNLGAEHLDFHNTIEDYFETKASLFERIAQGGSAIINVDNPWGKKLSERIIKNSNIHLHAVSQPDSSVFQSPSLFGSFNAYNLAAAYAACISVGIKSDICRNAMKTFGSVPGRLQMHRLGNGGRAFVDYAHEPLSFEHVLSLLRAESSHLIVLFGCGEARRYKRSPMGEIAARYGDLIILTDDNPRFDDPTSIIKDIMDGIPKEKQGSVIIEHDRSKAIAYAVSKSNENSVVALLGKGHEKTQALKEKSFYWSDFEEISRY